MTAPMPRPGERVGPYRLLEVAGEGGMGVVYRAADTALHDRIVAVKVMAAHLSAEPAYRAAFLHEAHVAAEVSHPHVVPVHAAGEADGLLYLAMAWIEGRDLRVLGQPRRPVGGARGGDRPPDRASARRRHDAGIVHGDVKPSNVLVHREDGEDHAYLLDFGVARRTEYADPRTNELVGGTPAYAAPETASGPPDPATDLYSLGVRRLRAADRRAAVRQRRRARPRPPPRGRPAPTRVRRRAGARQLRRGRRARHGPRPGRALPVGRRVRPRAGPRPARLATSRRRS